MHSSNDHGERAPTQLSFEQRHEPEKSTAENVGPLWRPCRTHSGHNEIFDYPSLLKELQFLDVALILVPKSGAYLCM